MKSRKSSGQPKKPKYFLIRRVEGVSMLPVLTPGQVVVARPTTALQLGDVVIIYHQGHEKIKRVAKRQGNALYVLGDNPSASTDSRNFGWVPTDVVLGRVVWPKL